MAKRKTAVASSDEEEYNDRSSASGDSSPERPMQTARRGGKRAKKNDSNDESEEEKPISSKKAKTSKPPSIKKPKISAKKDDGEEESMGAGDVKFGVDESGGRYVELGKKRRATVRQFKGATFVDIREFYGDENDLKPGKKGISLNREQWEALKKGSDAIDSFFNKMAK
ncbi:PC4-domain-containing protein [Trametes coccinea BRFM310]|uniref:PC4-domain-containing protein n=1 Tax=Trametes coccinea (strain BRFM310) TaxID=1353009 RepID=A0A1Y2IJL2_TRAC3|nr:PC4-domain-containing protein [Trametes coccinea BRFM310]